MNPIEILNEIREELKEKFDNDPMINRIARMIITEFILREEFYKGIKEETNET
jgi:hypothetical protein